MLGTHPYTGHAHTHKALSCTHIPPPRPIADPDHFMMKPFGDDAYSFFDRHGLVCWPSASEPFNGGGEHLALALALTLTSTLALALNLAPYPRLQRLCIHNALTQTCAHFLRISAASFTRVVHSHAVHHPEWVQHDTRVW